MNKFKFGDKVLHDIEPVGFGVVISTENGESYVAFKSGTMDWFSDAELTPTSDWVKCSERMPDCDDLRERPHKALFWIYCQLDGRNFVTRAYRQHHSNKWAWVDKLTTKGQMILMDVAVTHYMPIIEPTPPQD